MFTDLLTRNKRAAAAGSESAQNPKQYSVPDGGPRTRKGSTFTDLLSWNKKPSTVQENGIQKSNSSFRKPSIIMEEVKWKPKNMSIYSLFDWLTYSSFFFCGLQSDDLTEVSRAPSLKTVKEDSDVMAEEEPTLDRPLTSLEKLHIIVGYAIVRRDLRLKKLHLKIT